MIVTQNPLELIPCTSQNIIPTTFTDAESMQIWAAKMQTQLNDLANTYTALAARVAALEAKNG